MLDAETSSGAPAPRPRVKYLAAEQARLHLGWQPEVALHEGLERTVAWYRQAFSEEG